MQNRVHFSVVFHSPLKVVQINFIEKDFMYFLTKKMYESKKWCVCLCMCEEFELIFLNNPNSKIKKCFLYCKNYYYAFIDRLAEILITLRDIFTATYIYYHHCYYLVIWRLIEYIWIRVQ